ncbi:MAG: cytochrome b N-terminal domain-containing protein [Chloroflexota bacterium]
MLHKIFIWFDERLDLSTIYRVIFDRKVPKVNWWFTLGSASLFLFIIQAATGIFLSVYYVPSPEHAYNSIQYIMNDVAFGWLLRGIHHWGASLMVLAVLLHMLRVFYYASYKYPRELTWLTGVILLLITMGMGFTGYLLPWNQRSYWATVVGTRIVGTIPSIGDFLLRILRGGTDISAVTLMRFYSVHIWWFPALLGLLLVIHLYLIIRLGISGIPHEDD